MNTCYPGWVDGVYVPSDLKYACVCCTVCTRIRACTRVCTYTCTHTHHTTHTRTHTHTTHTHTHTHTYTVLTCTTHTLYHCNTGSTHWPCYYYSHFTIVSCALVLCSKYYWTTLLSNFPSYIQKVCTCTANTLRYICAQMHTVINLFYIVIEHKTQYYVQALHVKND